MFYLAMMIVIGAVYMKKTSSSEDYFLGGRGLNGWVAALSAQASDMSGWLLMGLPGAIYSLGSGQIWIAVGLFIGTVLNWVCISGRLRKYTIVANNSMTIPAFFENRYRDKKKILLLISSIVIVVFFLVYTASALAAGGKLFNTVFGLDYHVALAIGAAVILCYTFMGGFMAVCVTDFVQGPASWQSDRSDHTKWCHWGRKCLPESFYKWRQTIYLCGNLFPAGMGLRILRNASCSGKIYGSQK